VERVYRDIRGLCIGAGTVEIQRNFIGTNLLKGRVPSGAAWRPPTRG
jgi:alkylation response protein AidB-like acyl-CoA dehydrogenase